MSSAKPYSKNNTKAMAANNLNQSTHIAGEQFIGISYFFGTRNITPKTYTDSDTNGIT